MPPARGGDLAAGHLESQPGDHVGIDARSVEAALVNRQGGLGTRSKAGLTVSWQKADL